jgi:hypothetical protein
MKILKEMAGGEAEKLTGLSKTFNSVTYTGRANVSCYYLFVNRNLKLLF